MTKICSRCKTKKEHSEFRKSKKGDKFGLHSWCKDCQRHSRRDDYAKNPEKYAEWNRQWNEANPERRRELEAARDPQYMSAKYKAYIKTNPDKKRGYDHNYRARKLAADGILTETVIQQVLETYGQVCLNCKRTDNIEIDHVIPLTLGGTNLFDNLQPLCKSCNSSKGNRSCADYRKGAK